MTLGAYIPDARLAERQPVTARLLRAYRGHVRALGMRDVFSPVWGGSTGSATYVTVATLPIYVPDCFIGSLGTRLTLTIARQVVASGGGGPGGVAVPGPALVQLKIGAVVSDVVNDFTNNVRSILWTPAGNAVENVELQAHIVRAGDTVTVSCDGHLYIAQEN